MDTIITDLNFNAFNYYPTLRSRLAEMRALKELDDIYKREIIPLITLNNWGQYDFFKAAEKVSEAVGNFYYFLDLPSEKDISIWDKMNAYPECATLKNEDDNYSNWVDFVLQKPNAIPVIQMGYKIKPVIQQVNRLEQQKGKIAFRIRDYIQDTPIVIAAISVMDNIENAIVFIDAQYIRDSFDYHRQMIINTINQLRSQEPSLTICILSTSFPVSPATFVNEEGKGAINIMEHDLFRSIGGRDVAIYGDHSSVHSVLYDDKAYTWSARIDYPLDKMWAVIRAKGEKGDAYGRLAREILSHFSNINSPQCWGERKIYETAQGNTYAKAPANWISVRINIHLMKQILFSNQNFSRNSLSKREYL